MLRRVLADMRGIQDTRRLLEKTPELVARLGFDRILVSFIVDGIWVPETIFLRRDPAWARDIVTAGRDEPTPLDGVLVETEVVRCGVALVVDDVQADPRVHRPIALISRSDNHGVVPVWVGGEVAAMIHADCYFSVGAGLGGADAPRGGDPGAHGGGRDQPPDRQAAEHHRGTVKTHVKHVLRKLGAANRAEAVSRWLRAG